MTASNALRPSALLALSVHAQPGVHAVFLGSGVSKGAGLPTGWDIVTDLVARVARLHDAGAEAHARKDPEAWWHSAVGTELGYSELLERVASTPAERQGILEGYFEPKASTEDEEQRLGPSRAHKAIAKLVKQGFIKVIITTNFDRLMEQALTAEDIHPQVVSSAPGIAGMKPLAHAPATVIKINGDYKDLNIRNTLAELESYEEEWLELLQQVFSDYGLIVSGWSAQWDKALASGIEAVPNFRYPLFWDSLSGMSGRAQQILAKRKGEILKVDDADELFDTLLTDIEALERMTQPQLTTDMAVAKLKKWLLDPTKRIDIHDLVFSHVEHVEEAMHANPSNTLEEQLRRLLEATRPLLHLAAASVKHDHDAEHDRLWIDVLQRLLDVRQEHGGYGQYTWIAESQHYPAQLLLFTIASVAVSHRRDEMLLKIQNEVHWHHPAGNRQVPALYALHLNNLLDREQVAKLPRWNGTSWIWPADMLIREDLRELLAEYIRQGSFDQMMDDAQYRIGLLQCDHPGRPNAGAYASHVKSGQGGLFLVEERFIRDVVRQGRGSPWVEYLSRHGKKHLPDTTRIGFGFLGDEEISAGIRDMHENLEIYSKESW